MSLLRVCHRFLYTASYHFRPASSISRRAQNRCLRQERQQKDQVPEGEHFQELPPAVWILPRKDLIGDQARKGGDERPQAAQVHSGQKSRQIRGKTGQEDGCRHVAHDLACQHAGQQLPALHHGDKESADLRDALDISHKDKEKEEGQQEEIVHLQIQPAVDKRRHRDHDEEHRNVRQHMEHHQQAEDEKTQVGKDAPHQFPHIRPVLPLRPHIHQRLIPPQQDRSHEKEEGQPRVGEHRRRKAAARQTGYGVEVQVLWVADGRGHAAQVGRHRLQHHQLHDPLRLPDHAEHKHGKRHERKKRHIVGDEHAGEKAQQHHDRRQRPQAPRPAKERMSHHGEHPFGLKARHNDHQAEQKGEGPVVRVGQIGLVRMDEKG